MLKHQLRKWNICNSKPVWKMFPAWFAQTRGHLKLGGEANPVGSFVTAESCSLSTTIKPGCLWAPFKAFMFPGALGMATLHLEKVRYCAKRWGDGSWIIAHCCGYLCSVFCCHSMVSCITEIQYTFPTVLFLISLERRRLKCALNF